MEEEDEEEVVEVDGEEAPAEDHRQDHGVPGEDNPAADMEEEVPSEVLRNPSQPCLSQTNLVKPSIPPFPSQPVQLEATPGSAARSTVTGRPATGQTGEPPSLVAPVCTTTSRRRGARRKRLGSVWLPAL